MINLRTKTFTSFIGILLLSNSLFLSAAVFPDISLPDEEILNSGYENFTLVNMEILEIEWLYLHRHGHRRAKFIINNKDLVKKVWLTP